MRKLIPIFLLIVGLSLLIAPSLTAVGQNSSDSGQWSAPMLLGEGWWQSVTLDREGRLHVGWYDGIPFGQGVTATSGDVLEYASRSIDGTWTQPNNVKYTGNGGYTVRNALSVTSDGILHAVYRANTLHEFASAYSVTASDASTWSDPIQISDYGYYIDMIADDEDTLHIIYSGQTLTETTENVEGNPEGSACASCGDLIYRRSTNGGASWSADRPLFLTPNTGSDKMSFFTGANDRIYLEWDEGNDWYVGRGLPQDVRIIYSDDQGVTWSDPIILDGDSPANFAPIQLGATEMRDGTLMAVWRYSSDADRGIYYQTSADDGVTWTAPAAIPGIIARPMNNGPLDDYEVVTDVNGSVHVFAVGLPDALNQNNPSLYHLVYRQGLWLPPQRLFYSPEMCPEWPQAVMGPQNDIHLTWFIRGIPEQYQCQTIEGNTDILRVYYTHMTGNIPQGATEAFDATRTPLPTPTTFQNLNPTLTPFPTIQAANDVAAFVSTQDLYVSEAFVGGLIAAALFCVIIVTFLRLRR